MAIQEIDGEQRQTDDAAVEDEITITDIRIIIEDAKFPFTDNPSYRLRRPDPHPSIEDIRGSRIKSACLPPIEERLESETKIAAERCILFIQDD